MSQVPVLTFKRGLPPALRIALFNARHSGDRNRRPLGGAIAVAGALAVAGVILVEGVQRHPFRIGCCRAVSVAGVERRTGGDGAGEHGDNKA